MVLLLFSWSEDTSTGRAGAADFEGVDGATNTADGGSAGSGVAEGFGLT